MWSLPNIHRTREDVVSSKFWIISFQIRGQEVVTMFTQEIADLARALAVDPKLVDRLDTKTMTVAKKGDET